MGQFQIKVDDKGRLTLPVQAYELIENDSLILTLSVYNKKVYLELLSSTDWSKKMERINKLTHLKAKALKRFVLSSSTEVGVDKQNRIRIPSYQRKALNLKKEAFVIAVGNRVEIWSETNWNQTFLELVDEIEAIEESTLLSIEGTDIEITKTDTSDAQIDLGGRNGLKSAA